MVEPKKSLEKEIEKGLIRIWAMIVGVGLALSYWGWKLS